MSFDVAFKSKMTGYVVIINYQVMHCSRNKDKNDLSSLVVVF